MNIAIILLAFGFALALLCAGLLYIRVRDLEEEYDELFERFRRTDDARQTLEQANECLQREHERRIEELKKIYSMPRKTNRDNLNDMTNEQLAEWLSAETSQHGYSISRGYWFDWLRREVNK